jgi:hypothetical protein
MAGDTTNNQRIAHVSPHASAVLLQMHVLASHSHGQLVVLDAALDRLGRLVRLRLRAQRLHERLTRQRTA